MSYKKEHHRPMDVFAEKAKSKAYADSDVEQEVDVKDKSVNIAKVANSGNSFVDITIDGQRVLAEEEEEEEKRKKKYCHCCKRPYHFD